MTSGFLTKLDAAVQQQCACLCGQPITNASPSAYFASEVCAERWHHPTRSIRVNVTASVDVEGFVASLRQAMEQVCAATRTVVAALAPVADKLRRLADALQPIAETPPDDPRGLALWLRRRRNTGPTRNARVLPQITPPTGFFTAARGRPAYRRTRG